MQVYIILHNINTTKKLQKFIGQRRQKYHNVEFIVTLTLKFCNNLAYE